MTFVRVVGGAAALVLVLGGTVASAEARARTGKAITVEAEAPARANIKRAADRRASGGAYLSLNTTQAPSTRGWYASYTVDVPVAGVYRLDVVATPPAMPDRLPRGGSQFSVSVNGGPSAQVARSEPFWTGTPGAWGALVKARLDDVELRRGANTITFRVDEERVSTVPVRYAFALDKFTLTSTPIALKGVYIGDPGSNLGVYRGRSTDLRFRLNGRTSQARTVRYNVTNYFSARVAGGTATIPSGATMATVELPSLPPGNYRATAALDSSPGSPAVGYFASLPEQGAVEGTANRFGVTTSVPWLVPSAKLDAFAAALRQMGAGYVREEIYWPAVEPKRGAYDTRSITRIAQAFHKHGINTLGALWTLSGNHEAPKWAMTKASAPMPADLRDAYNLTHHLAGRAGQAGPHALELWNEPDVDVIAGLASRIRGDQHAAYLKAAALGLADHPKRPLISLSGIAYPEDFHEVMLQNDVVRYADIWSFHGYGESYKPSKLSPLPTQPAANQRLRRKYGAKNQTWMTESGLFIEKSKGDLTQAQQVDQARFLVQSTVDDLASGTDKHFWFSGSPYCASAYACFGLFSSNFQPWPSYSAHAAMTSILGEANFAAKVRGLPPNASGYTFRNKGQAITVLWAGKPTQVKIPVPGEKADVYDIMGVRKQQAIPAASGTVRVTASLDPIYLVTDGAHDLPARKTPARLAKPSTAERIVLSQRYGAEAMSQPEPFGYRLGKTTRMTVEVYNFNHRPQTVTLSGQAYGGWSLKPAGKRTVRIPAKGRVAVPFVITAACRVKPGVDYPLAFKATVGKHRIPPSVARIHLKAMKPGARWCGAGLRSSR